MSTDNAARPAEGHELPTAIRVSDRLRQFVDLVGRFGSWLILPLILVTVFDVTARKLVWIQIWLVEHLGRIFESTLLQELEWHFHTALFALVLGFGYIYNTHVRVDLVRETLSFRKKAWIEFLGLTFFMIPYLRDRDLFRLRLRSRFLHDRRDLGLAGRPQPPLDHQEHPRGRAGVAAISGIAVWLQVAFVLWGRRTCASNS